MEISRTRRRDERAFQRRYPHDCMLHMQTELSLSQGQSANAHARHDAVEALLRLGVAMPSDPLRLCHRPAHLSSEPPATDVLCAR